MKPFDIEKYAKKILEGHALKLTDEAWDELSAKLNEQEQKKDQWLAFKKTALFIAVFMFGMGFIGDNNHRQLNFPLVEVHGNIDKAEKSNTVLSLDTQIQKDDTAALVANTPPKKEDSSAGQEKTQKLDAYLAGREKGSAYKVLATYDQPLEDLSIRKKMEVTDAEIDSLLRIARENVQLEKLLLRHEGRAILTEEEVLAHSDIKIDDEPDFYDRGVSFNKVLWEFLKIKSVFAN